MHKALVLWALAMVIPGAVDAGITRMEITRTESPAFEGAVFGDVGQYEKLVGRAYGEVDPEDPRHHVIADISLAPRNARGMVEYAMDIMILRPLDPARGNGRLLFDINNRGGSRALNAFNDATSGVNDPKTARDVGNGFLMRRGYTVLVAGWDATVTGGDGRFTITLPVAKQPDGSSIVGPALEEFVIDDNTTMTGRLTYPAASLDRTRASLTVRQRYEDQPVAVPLTQWEFVDDKGIRLLPSGTAFQQGRLYEFTYPAKDPLVVGLAFAATRDVASFLRQITGAAANPLNGRIRFVYSFCVSQPCRFMREFVHLGFNEDEARHKVFDGVFNWVGGPSGGFFNYRFAQPARTHRQRIGRSFPERLFPFANQTVFDPVTKSHDGRLRRCTATATCPQIFEANSSNEYWVKTGSLLHTDLMGNDLLDAPNVRLYLFSSLPHNVASAALCQQPENPVSPNAGLRALLVALDEWVSARKPPPPSRVPRRDDGTLVPSLPQAGVGFPNIPGVQYSGLMTTGDVFDFGPRVAEGVLTTLPPVIERGRYPAFVPRTDADGNDFAGIRFPDVAVPLATYTGWNLRAPQFGGGDLCDGLGQKIAFAATRAEKLKAGDPRLSIEERYVDHAAYVAAVERSARQLAQDRYLLDEDVNRIVAAAGASAVRR